MRMNRTIESLLTIGIAAGGGYLLYAKVPVIKDFVDHLLNPLPTPVARDLPPSAAQSAATCVAAMDDDSPSGVLNQVKTAQKAGAGSVAVGGMLTSQTKPATAQSLYAAYTNALYDLGQQGGTMRIDRISGAQAGA